MTLQQKNIVIVQHEKCLKELKYYGKVLVDLMLKIRIEKNLTFNAKHYRYKVGRWQNFNFANEIMFL